MRTGWTRWLSLSPALTIVLAGELAAADPPQAKSEAPKPPSPTATVQALLKSLSRAKSYKVSVDIEGGFASQPDHAVTQRTVQEAYSGEVSGPLMRSPSPKSYRTTAKGVAMVDGQWRAILSDPASVKMDRLFKFPETILQRALKHAKQGAWVAESVPAPEDESAAAEADDEEEDEPPAAPKGKTVVVTKKPKKGANEAAARLPRLLRITASPEEALAHILEVQNSNCFGGG